MNVAQKERGCGVGKSPSRGLNGTRHVTRHGKNDGACYNVVANPGIFVEGKTCLYAFFLPPSEGSILSRSGL